MKNLYNIKMKQEMVRNIERGIDHLSNLKAKREERFFNNTGEQCALHESLSRQSKIELDNIRKTYGFIKMSALKKADLAYELNIMIPAALKQIFNTMDRTRYGLLMRIVRGSGVISYADLSGKEREELRKYGVLFHGVSGGRKILYIPIDLLTILRKMDRKEIEVTVERNTEWILLTQGLLYYFGVIETPRLHQKVSSYSSFLMDISSYSETINSAAEYYGQIKIRNYQYHHRCVKEAERVKSELKELGDFSDYPFSKNQLLRAGEPNYKTLQMKKLLRVLQEEYAITSRELDEIADQLIELINMTGSSILIMTYLERVFEFPSPDYMNLIEMLVKDLCNNTHMWVLKGFTLKEMEAKENKVDKEVSPDLAGRSLITVDEPLIKMDRTGRNDKCPCGSGRKYKKCCGGMK